MLSGSRSNTGCWTCRARRKKCDEKKPHCSTCESLRLVCHGYGQRPDWMDSGVKERAQARAFKAVVRRNNILRRQSKARNMVLVGQVDEVSQPTDARNRNDETLSNALEVQTSCSQQNPALSYNAHGSLTPPADATVRDRQRTNYNNDLDEFQNDLVGFNQTNILLWGPQGHRDGSNQQFPFPEALFGPASNPLTTPTYLGNLYGTAAGLADWEPFHLAGAFFGTVMPDLSPVSAGDKELLLVDSEKLSNGPSIAVQPADKTLTMSHDFAPHERGALRYYSKTVFPTMFPFMPLDDARHICCQILAIAQESRICQSSILAQSVYWQQSQLRRFGLGSSSLEETSLNHESAAVEGLLQILRRSRHIDDEVCDESIHIEAQVCTAQLLLSQMLRGSKNWPIIIEVVASFNSIKVDQMIEERRLCLGFCQNILVCLEILSCTFTGAEPKFSMQFMHRRGAEEMLPRLSDITGIESWMMFCLMNITTLRRWKEDELSKGSLSMTELVKRAGSIEHDLQHHRQENLERINSQPVQDSWIFTNVFACAASVFLHATISESRPQILEIKQGVSDTIDALQLLPSPELLKRLAWPICIAACLADSSRYEFFNSLSQRVAEAYGKGENISRALAVARECWKLRGSTGRDDQTYDWKDAMRSLGTILLLY